MSKYYGPRLRVIRRLGELPALTQKIQKRDTRPGQHGANRRKPTQFSYRLIEKQKLRFYYGISEKQLIRYVKVAQREKGPTGKILLQRLERRLDNIIYRLGWSQTLPRARQLVSHGHILVNKIRVTIPSYPCSPQETISVQNIEKRRYWVENVSRIHNKKLPSNLSVNIENLTASIHQKFDRHDILLNLNELLVIEYYSNRLLIKFSILMFCILCLQLFCHRSLYL
jgi:small subunit ribosomal protein S4